VVVAAVRAVARLAAISLVITAILNSGWLTGLFVALMFIVAAITAARRIGVRPHVRWVAAAIAGVCPVLVRCGGVGTDRGGAHRGDPDRRRDDGNLAGGASDLGRATRGMASSRRHSRSASSLGRPRSKWPGRPRAMPSPGAGSDVHSRAGEVAWH
jgi:hypothetical protein